MRKYIILISILFLQFLSKGQNTDYLQPLKDLAPKAPDVAALEKFTTIPPGSYTGTSSFSVPIYTINMNGISLPVSIDYHASGIKVGDVASRIGLGWALNIGGLSLSKQIVGIEDTDHILSYDVVNFNPVHQNISDDDYFIAQRATGCSDLIPKDTQPDIYSFNINGESGQFVIDSENNIHQIPYSQIKIERTDWWEFTFTNTSGVKFKFIQNGMQYTLGGNGFTQQGHTNFKITEIEFLNGEKIFFNYKTRGFLFPAKYMISRMTSEVIETNGLCSDIGLRSFELNTSEVYEYVLTSISFDQGTLYFKYSDEKPTPTYREDIVDDVYCYSIQLKNNNNFLLKDFLLNQSYFVSPGYVADTYLVGWENYLEPMRKASYYRLKLDSIIENNSLAEYNFEYDQEHTMPHRLSFDTDYWGFYNGRNNTGDLPRVLFNNRFIGEADREPNFNYGKTCSLKKVILPTGGYQEFFYENDDFYYNGIIENYTPYNFEIDTQNGANINQNYSFLLNGDVDQVLEFIANPNPLNAEPEGSVPNVSNYIYGVVLDQNLIEIERIYLNGEKKVILPHNQTCYLKIIKVGSGTFTGSLKLRWYKNDSYVGETNKIAGTLRINKVVLNDGVSNAIVRKYEYKNPSTNFSSGYNHGDELIPYTIVRTLGNAAENNLSPCTLTCEKTVLSNNSGIRLNVVNGKSVGYDYVKEIYQNENDPTKNYYTISHFSNDYDYNQNLIRVSPIVPREDNSFMRGLLLQKSHFDNNDNEKYRETISYEFDNHYNTLSSDNYGPTLPLISALKIDFTDLCNIITSGGINMTIYRFDWREYQIYSAWVKKTKEEIEEFFPSGTIYTKKEYEYDLNHRHTFTKTIRKTTSIDGVSKVNNMYYPQDIIMNNEPHVYSLNSRNMINTPLKVEEFEGTNKLSEQITKYGAYPSDNGGLSLLLPQYIYAGKETTIEKKLTFNSYDTKGNITEYTLENGTPVSILWGYNKTLPIAKIENATNAEIETFMSVNDSNSLTEANLSAINNLRSLLPNTMVTTYTHIPLIGVETITDPKGDTMTYEYDSFGRLKAVYDKKGYKLAENEYHYRTQN